MANNLTDIILNDPDISYMGNNPKSPFGEEGCQCADGWAEIILTALKDVAKVDSNKVMRIGQIKEKFGGLRLYMDYPHDGGDMLYDVVNKITSQAEHDSYSICENCGSKDNVTQSTKGWIRTLCKICRKVE